MSGAILPSYTTQVSNTASGPPMKPSLTAQHLKISEEELRDHPWKYLGYRAFARWAASSKAFLIIRQFSTLNARVLLALQDDISLLEEQLDLLERSYSRPGPEDDDNGSFRRDTHIERKVLMEKIQVALEKYNHFINEYTQIQNRPPAPKQDIESVKVWLRSNHPDAIAEEETRFIDQDDDLISVRPLLKSPVRKYFESSMWSINFFPKIFQRQPRDNLIVDGNTFWYDDEKFERIVSILVSFAGLLMFIAPFWALDSLKNSSARLGLITGFVMLFYAIVASGTSAKPFESLGASAAYAAVLMVFLQASSKE